MKITWDSLLLLPSLLTELNRKVDKLKADLELVLQKIKVIDESLKAEE